MSINRRIIYNKKQQPFFQQKSTMRHDLEMEKNQNTQINEEIVNFPKAVNYLEVKILVISGHPNGQYIVFLIYSRIRQ